MTQPRSAGEQLWCVNVEGPDDIHAAPNKEAADERAVQLNAFYARLVADHAGDPHWPRLKAVVIPWPYSPESHAANLPKWEEA